MPRHDTERTCHLLSYQWKHHGCSEIGPGWDWDTRLKVFRDKALLLEEIRDLEVEIAEERERWERFDPRWREATFVPPYRDIRIYALTRRWTY